MKFKSSANYLIASLCPDKMQINAINSLWKKAFKLEERYEKCGNQQLCVLCWKVSKDQQQRGENLSRHFNLLKNHQHSTLARVAK